MSKEIKTSLSVYIISGYNNSAQVIAEIDGERYVIDKEHVVEILEDLIVSQGYEIRKTNKQKNARVFINK